MEGMVDRVSVGRIFKSLAALVRGNNHHPKNVHNRPETTTDSQISDSKPTVLSNLHGNLSFLSDCVGQNRKNATRSIENPSNAPHDLTSQNAHDVSNYEKHRSDVTEIDNEMQYLEHLLQYPASWQSANPPPVNARYMKIFTYPGHGQLNSGLALTDTLIWQLNTIYQSDDKIEGYAKRIAALAEREAEAHSMA